MSQVEIKITVDPKNVKHRDALKNLLDVLGESETTPVVLKSDTGITVENVEEKVAAKPTRKRPSRAKKKVVEEAEKPAQKEEPAENDLTIEKVREKLAEKVGTNRDAIKAKLEELGTKNVTNLSVDKYVEFVEFLSTL